MTQRYNVDNNSQGDQLMKKVAAWTLIAFLFIGVLIIQSNPTNESLTRRLSSQEDFSKYINQVQRKQLFNRLFPQNAIDTSGGAVNESTDNYTPTNNQVANVDEADVMKTNGQYIYVLDNNKLIIYQAYPIEEAKLIKTIDLSNDENLYYSQVLIFNDKLILLGSSGYYWHYDIGFGVTRSTDDADDNQEQPNEAQKPGSSTDPYEGEDEPSSPDEGEDEPSSPGEGEDEPSSPGEGEDEPSSPGEGEDEPSSPDKPDDLPYVDPKPMTVHALIYDVSNPYLPTIAKSIEIEGYLSAARLIDNTLVIVSNKYNDMLMYRTENIDHKDVLPQRKVDDVVIEPRVDEITVSEPNSINMLTIAKFNLVSNQFQFENFMGNSNIVYMTEDRLFIASSLYDISDTKTIIYQFDIRDTLTFLNEAKIDGYLINSFAMDYYDNHLRVATTIAKNETTVNAVIVLNSNLKQVGIVDNLAQGEVIFSVLFKQDIAYAVTFEQIDPFFVIDLSTPTRPTVLGELKIPGFSSYLHQLDENFVLGFGKDTKFENNMVTTTAFKLSLFDVSNKQDPKEVDQLLFGGFGTHSDVLYDHKALMVDPIRNLYGFMLTDWTFDLINDNGRDIAVVNAFTYRYQLVKVDDSKIVDVFYQDSSKDEYYIRSLIIADSLYIISNFSLEIISLDDFTTIKNIPN